jgi:hypothetical protein
MSEFTDDKEMTHEEKLLQSTILRSLITGHATRPRQSTKIVYKNQENF